MAIEPAHNIRAVAFAPNGSVAERIMLRSWDSQRVQLNTDGSNDGWDADDCEMQEYAPLGRGTLIDHSEGVAWFTEHCRLMPEGVYDDLTEIEKIAPWPEDVQQRCLKMLRLAEREAFLVEGLAYHPELTLGVEMIDQVAHTFLIQPLRDQRETLEREHAAWLAENKIVMLSDDLIELQIGCDAFEEEV